MLKNGKIYLFTNLSPVSVGWPYVSSQNCRACELVSWVGSSEKGWENAAQTAVREEAKTIHGIRGIEVKEIAAKIEGKTGKIQKFRGGIKLAYGVDRKYCRYIQ
jgi:dodecin